MNSAVRPRPFGSVPAPLHPIDAITSGLISAGRGLLGNLHLGQLLRARGTLPGSRARPFLLWEDQVFTYEDVLREAERYAALFRRKRHSLYARRALPIQAPLILGIYRENSPSFVFAVLGAALDGDTVVALNTGFRGDTLVELLEKAGVRLLLAGAEQRTAVEAVLGRLRTLRQEDVIVDAASAPGMRTLEEALGSPATESPGRAHGEVLLVVYTSGTTAAPKGIGCSHLKLLGAGILTWKRIGLVPRDRGYVCMPLFHSNAWFLGIMPLLIVGGSFVLKRRFSASAFEDDILSSGVTYMNYVGQPLHYILDALEKRHGSPAGVRAALAQNPRNRFRIAHGNGATPGDREKLVRYLGMRHVYELYGSTEAVINAVVQPGDPVDSVGRIPGRVVILNERDEECPPAVVDDQGRLLNYEAAVGEICARLKRESVLFDGYYGDAAATGRKYRNGFYRSGDLGHVRVVGGRRYLYFDGRTDDWIRKDGENFSAESVARFVRQDPDVELAVAYGAPAPVSDELVEVALQLRAGATFDPDVFHARLLQHQQGGGMDPKWMPDFVRIADRLPTTDTDKVLVRQLKREGFDLALQPDMRLYWRRRGDATYRRFERADYDVLREELSKNGRAHLLRGG